jgi:hypothetical protein
MTRREAAGTGVATLAASTRPVLTRPPHPNPPRIAVTEFWL